MNLQVNTSSWSADIKIKKGTVHLTLRHTFFGTSLTRMPIVERDDLATMATDGKKVYWNRAFTDSLSPQETATVLLHEILHVLFKHVLRMRNRNHKLWNIACDHAVNWIIYDIISDDPKSGLSLPDGALLDPEFKGLTAEVIYNRLNKQQEEEDKQEKDGQGQGGSGLQPQPWGEMLEPTNEDGSVMSEADLSTLEADIDQMILNAPRTAGNLPSAVKGLIDELLTPKVDWRDKLRRFANGGDQPDDYTYEFFDIVTYRTTGILDPVLETKGVGKLIIFDDQSGSVRTEERKLALAELNEISLTCKPTSVTLIPFDTSIDEENIAYYQEGEEITSLERTRCGGTAVTPCFQYLEDNHLIDEDTKVMFLTDMGIGDYPDTAPPCEVLWINTSGYEVDAPFGETIHVKD